MEDERQGTQTGASGPCWTWGTQPATGSARGTGTAWTFGGTTETWAKHGRNENRAVSTSLFDFGVEIDLEQFGG